MGADLKVIYNSANILKRAYAEDPVVAETMLAAFNVNEIVKQSFRIMEHAAPILKKLREEKGVSAADVAEAIGSTEKSIKEYEAGQRIPRDEMKIKIAEYYGVECCKIFYDFD